MVTRLQTLDPRLLRRRCLACGYDGALLRDGLAPLCARCGCDLCERPARSYAEMEDLGDEPGAPALKRPRTIESLHEARLAHRWIAFLFLAMSGLMLIVYLAATAFSV